MPRETRKRTGASGPGRTARKAAGGQARRPPTAPAPKGAHIWMVRHGQAEGNTGHILNGNRIDAPLTALDRRQAEALARTWDPRADALLSSPLTRAVSTARALSKRWRMPVAMARLAEEMDYGDLTGLTFGKAYATLPRKLFHVDRATGQGYILQPPGGESWAALRRRAAKFLAWADKRYAGRRIVVVSHSDFINMCYGVRRGLPDEAIWKRRDVPNGGYVRL